MTFDYITMDEVNYYVYVTFDTMKRSFEIVEGENKGTALTGRTIRDIIGTKYSYEFEVQPNPAHYSDYDTFYNAITAPTDHHVITLPFGQNTMTFECMVESGDDEFKGQYGDDNLWESFTVKCLPMEPQIITDTYGNQSIPSSAIVIGTLNISANGTYRVPSNLTGWGTVTADVTIPSLTETTVTSNGVYEPTSDYEAFSKVTVAVPSPVLQELNVTENGVYTPATGITGYSKVTVGIPCYLENPVCVIKASYNVGSICTCTNGTVTLASDTSGTYLFCLPSAGTWTLESDGETKTATVENYKFASVNMVYTYIYESGFGAQMSLYKYAQRSASIVDNDIKIALTLNGSGNCQTCIRTSSAIDITDYTKVYFDLECTGLGSEYTYQGRFICSSTPFTVDTFNQEIAERIVVNSTRHIKEIDISLLSGNMYIGTSGAWGGNLYNIYLE